MANRSVKAQHRERMIEVKVRFFTDGMAEKGYIIPKHAWTNGSIQMDRNNSHGIVPRTPLPFNSLMEIPSVIEKVLIRQGVNFRLARKMSKYIN